MMPFYFLLRSTLCPRQSCGHQEHKHISRCLLGSLKGCQTPGWLLHWMQPCGHRHLDALQQQTRQADQVGKVHFNSYFRNSKILITADPSSTCQETNGNSTEISIVAARNWYNSEIFGTITRMLTELNRKDANERISACSRFVCHGLTTGANYVFRVKAVNAAGYSLNSSDSEAVVVKAAIGGCLCIQFYW